MRKMKSTVALVSTIAVMACQTAVASSALMREPPVTPAPSIANPAVTAQVAASPVRSEASSTSTAVAADGTSRKTWIIAGVVAAIIAVALIVAAGGTQTAY